MANDQPDRDLVEIGVDRPVWDRFFTVAPLVLVSTRDENGEADLAPKHMVTPMGWQNYFGFVCAPSHSTCANIRRTGEFAVSYPKPDQVLYTSLAATPRDAAGDKSVLSHFATFPARKVDADLIEAAYLYFECRQFKIVEGFGENCLITGEIVAAYVDGKYLRRQEIDGQDLVHDAPLLAYLSPGRFTSVSESNAFPFPANMKR